MDIVLQQAIDHARREDLAGNFIGVVKALTGAFESCDPGSEVYLCFELGKYYFEYGNMDSCIMMFSRAISGGFSKDAIDIFVARNLSDRGRMEEVYLHNQELLRNYHSFRARSAPKFFDIQENYVFSNATHTVVLGSDRKTRFIHTDTDNDTETLSDTVIFLANEVSLGRILYLEDKSRQQQKRKTPFYVYFDNEAAFWQMMTCMEIDTLLESKRVVFFFSGTEVEEYFSDTQTLLPDKIIDCSTEGIGVKMVEAARAKRDARMQRAYEHVSEYYEQNSALIRTAIIEGRIKMFFYTTRFDKTVAQYINSFLEAGAMLKYPVASITEKSEFSSNGLAEYTMIERLQPNIIFAVNSFRFDKDRLPREVIFLTLLYDLESVSLADCKSLMTDNDYILAPSNVCKTLYSSGISKAHIIEMPLLIAEPEVDRSALQHIMYSAEVCMLGDAVSPIKLLQEIISQELSLNGSALKPEYEACATEINHLYLNLFYAESIPFTLADNIDVISSVFKKPGIEVSDNELESVAYRLRTELCPLMYKINLATSLIRGGIKRLRIWGSGWADIPQLSNYCIGAINDDITLKKVLANAGVVVGSSLDKPSLVNIYNTVQCGGVYIENDYMEKKTKVQAMLKLKPETDIVYFSGKTELLQRVRDCLADESLRKKINASAKGNVKLSGAFIDVLAMAIEKIQANIKNTTNA